MLSSNIIEQIITALNVDLYKIIIIQNQIVNNFKTMIIQCDFFLSTNVPWDFLYYSISEDYQHFLLRSRTATCI